MTIYKWPSYINNNFYAYSHKRADNVTVTEFLSGRKAAFKNNTRNIDTLECSILLTKNEDKLFWEWFDDIGGLAGVFECSALGNSVYRFTETPSPSASQEYVTLSLSLEEVY